MNMNLDRRPHICLASCIVSELAILGGVTKISARPALGIQQKRTHNIGRTVPNIVGLVVRLGCVEANFAEHSNSTKKNESSSKKSFGFFCEDLKPRKKITNQFFSILTTIGSISSRSITTTRSSIIYT